jgi:hypothetical protein
MNSIKTLLIVFAILLLFLTLLAAFGGSIRYSEPFYDVLPQQRKIKSNFMPSIGGDETEFNEYFSSNQPSKDWIKHQKSKYVNSIPNNTSNPLPTTTSLPTTPVAPTNNSSTMQMPSNKPMSTLSSPLTKAEKLSAPLPAGTIKTSSAPALGTASSTSSVVKSNFNQGLTPTNYPVTTNLLPGFNIEPFEADSHASAPANY